MKIIPATCCHKRPLARVLARVSKLAVQKDFVGMAQYFRGCGCTKHVFWGVATIFCCYGIMMLLFVEPLFEIYL